MRAATKALLLLFLPAHSNRAAAREAALTWRHDELSIYVESESGEPIVVWSLEASSKPLDAVVRRMGALFPNTESTLSGERLRVATSRAPNLDLTWAVAGEL